MKNLLSLRGSRVFLITAGLLLIIFLGYLGYRTYRSLESVAADPALAIPDDALMAIKITDPQAIWSDELRSSALWELLIQDSSFSKHLPGLEKLDSALIRNKIKLEYRKDESFWVSAHPSDSGISWLFLLAPLNKGSLSELPGVLASYKPARLDGKVMSIKIPDAEIYYVIRKGLLIASCDLGLLKRALQQLSKPKSTSILASPTLRRFAGKHVDANLYLARGAVDTLISDFFPAGFSFNSGGFPTLNPAMELDVDLSKTELSAAGFSLVDGDDNRFLASFQSPGKLQVDSLLPASTSYLVTYSSENFQDWYETLFPDSFNVATDPVLSWVDGEIAVFGMSRTGDARIAALRTSDIEACRMSMRQMMGQCGSKAGDSLLYRNYFMARLHCPDPLAARFNNLIRCGDDPWFTFIEDYTFFSHSYQALQLVIDDYLQATTLVKNADYRDFMLHVGRSSNVLFYVDGRKANMQPTSLPASLFSSGLFAVQWVWDDGKYYTNACFRPLPGTRPNEGLKGWQFEMDDEVAWGPYTVDTHKDRSQRVLVMDRSRNMYFLNEKGQLLWKRRMTEFPFDTVIAIDVLKNGRIQYFLSSAGYVYVIDANGNDVPGFPKKLRMPAINPISVFDYDRTQDYRLLYCGKDRRIYNLSLEGNPISAWSPFPVKDSVLEPLQHFRLNEMDVLLARDRNGHIYLLDRKGNQRILVKRDVRFSGPLWLDTSREKHRLAGWDPSGRQALISQSGDVSFLGADSRIPEPQARYSNLTVPELIDRFPSLNLSQRIAELKTSQAGQNLLVSSEGKWIITFPL
jgi:hypothetical protein